MTKENSRFVFKRAENPDTAAHSQFTGEYLSEEAEARWTIGLDNKNLVVKVDRPGYDSPMKPLYKDAFETELGLVRFLRDGQNRVTGLEVTSGRARKVPFTKAK